MKIFCRIAFRGNLLEGLFQVYDCGDIYDEKGQPCDFEIGPDYHIVEII